MNGARDLVLEEAEPAVQALQTSWGSIPKSCLRCSTSASSTEAVVNEASALLSEEALTIGSSLSHHTACSIE